MTDRELLEAAAKAAGIEVTAIVADGIPHRFGGGYWNPLTDDGDALRLAVELKLTLRLRALGVEVFDPNTEVFIYEKYGDDRLVATRRAIVRTAAALGRGVE